MLQFESPAARKTRAMRLCAVFLTLCTVGFPREFNSTAVPEWNRHYGLDNLSGEPVRQRCDDVVRRRHPAGRLNPLNGRGGGDSGAWTATRLSTSLPPVLSQDNVVNAAGFQAGIASNSWFTILGLFLSPDISSWANVVSGDNLPTTLDGVSVSVGGQPAYVAYVSPTQINALAPNVGVGTVALRVSTPNGSSVVSVVSQTVQPAFFLWGDNYAAATHQDYTPAVRNETLSGLATVPAKPGDVIILWGTGFGSTSPAAPTGIEVPYATTFYTSNAVSVSVGGAEATVCGAAPVCHAGCPDHISTRVKVHWASS